MGRTDRPDRAAPPLAPGAGHRGAGGSRREARPTARRLDRLARPAAPRAAELPGALEGFPRRPRLDSRARRWRAVSTHPDARTAIRKAIRDSLDASRMHEIVDAETRADHGAPAPSHGAPTPPPDYSLAREWLTDRDRSPVEHFAARLEAVGGHFLVASSLTEASQVVGRILRDATA